MKKEAEILKQNIKNTYESTKEFSRMTLAMIDFLIEKKLWLEFWSGYLLSEVKKHREESENEN